MDREVLTVIPIFSELENEILDKIIDLLKKREYKRNNMILMEEEIGDTLFIINSGSVKITHISEDGREVILSILSEGDFFFVFAIFDGERRSANVIALEDSEVFLLERENFLDLLEKFPRIAIALLEELATRLRKSDQQIEGLSLSDAESRIAMTIIRLSEDLGTIKQGQVVIEKLPYQQDIANMSGTSRETVSRMLKLLEKKGMVVKDGRKITILDYDAFIKEFG